VAQIAAGPADAEPPATVSPSLSLFVVPWPVWVTVGVSLGGGLSGVLLALVARRRLALKTTELAEQRGLLGHAQALLRTRSLELAVRTDELVEERRTELAQNGLLEEQNRELQRANRLQAQFLAMVSHELRTPLNAINGFSELLLEEVVGPLEEAQRSYLHDVLAAGKHLLSLINDILDLSKMEAGQLQTERAPVDLGRAAQEALDMVRPLAEKKSLEVDLSLAAGCVVEGDAKRLKQVVLNLLSNAIKFTPRRGRLGLSVGLAPSGAVALVVKDSGVGIAPEHHAVIFEAFRQVDGGCAREFEGTGLGLSLVKKLLEPMGGTIEVHSALGEGAAFTVTLPALQAECDPRPRRPEAPQQIDVVLAEDDDATRHMLLRMLESGGCLVRAAPNGQRALEALVERLPQVLVLDLMMPELDGYQVVERLRSLPRGGEVAVLVFSACQPNEEQAARLVQHGVRVVVKGSVPIPEVVAQVQRCAQQPQAMRSAA
jgi:signal transduction histidine kinase/CheY-like chemotaxis protein